MDKHGCVFASFNYLIQITDRAAAHSRGNEAFGLVLVEALISGTPVICSDQGACPEIISSEVGFVCRNRTEYREAVDRLETISPSTCREKALREYHYLSMAADYVKEYEIEIAQQEQT